MSYVLEVERLIDAPLDIVYRARTDIDVEREIAMMHDGSSVLTGEVRVGGKRIGEWVQDGTKCKVTQTFLEITPGKVVYSELLEVPPSPVYESMITETMVEKEGKTIFHFHVEGFPTAEERDIHRQGYNIVLDRLENYLLAKGISGKDR